MFSHCFFPGLKSYEAFWTTHWRTMASFATPCFLHVYTCAQITQRGQQWTLNFELCLAFSSLVHMHKALSNECNNYSRSLNLKYSWCAWRQGETVIVDSVFEQWFFGQYCIHLLKKPVRTDLLLCDRWQISAQACTCCQEKKTKYY